MTDAAPNPTLTHIDYEGANIGIKTTWHNGAKMPVSAVYVTKHQATDTQIETNDLKAAVELRDMLSVNVNPNKFKRAKRANDAVDVDGELRNRRSRAPASTTTTYELAVFAQPHIPQDQLESAHSALVKEIDQCIARSKQVGKLGGDDFAGFLSEDDDAPTQKAAPPARPQKHLIEFSPKDVNGMHVTIDPRVGIRDGDKTITMTVRFDESIAAEDQPQYTEKLLKRFCDIFEKKNPGDTLIIEPDTKQPGRYTLAGPNKDKAGLLVDLGFKNPAAAPKAPPTITTPTQSPSNGVASKVNSHAEMGKKLSALLQAHIKHIDTFAALPLNALSDEYKEALQNSLTANDGPEVLKELTRAGEILEVLKQENPPQWDKKFFSPLMEARNFAQFATYEGDAAIPTIPDGKNKRVMTKLETVGVIMDTMSMLQFLEDECEAARKNTTDDTDLKALTTLKDKLGDLQSDIFCDISMATKPASYTKIKELVLQYRAEQLSGSTELPIQQAAAGVSP